MRKFYLIAVIHIVLLGCSTEPTFTNSRVYSDSEITGIWKEALVIEILSKTPELNSHRMNGEEENNVYYRDDGTEIVVDANKEMVTTPENKGSYNYYHPEKRPIAHYMADSKPWIIYGNDRLDSTTKAQRLEAYSKDLAIGISQAFEERNISSSMSSLELPSPEELREVRLWVQIFESASIFELYSENKMVTYKQALSITTNLVGDLP